MASTYYFYDLETTSTNPRTGRIMQFAGQRTDLNLKPLGEPDNIVIRLTDEVVPEPDAIMVTGITPQSTLADGITEAEFLRYFSKQICQPGTTFVGYNNVRFDDEFLRYTLYRNFYDAYEWCWQDNRGRWDLLDVIRMVRALRPEGITWPFAPDGKPSNRLELLTAVNKLDHTNAHDALSDVNATIALARLLRNKQTKMFEYLFAMRDKKKVAELVQTGKPFVYTSGKYPNVYEKTTVVICLGEHPGKQGVLVYDLRRDPSFLNEMTAEQIASMWHERVEDETQRFPVKTLQFNRCPAVAPLGVMDDATKERLSIDMDDITANQKKLSQQTDLYQKLVKALEILDTKKQVTFLSDKKDVDTLLYDGFFGEGDKSAMGVVRAADRETIGSVDIRFKDDRLNVLLPLYKARNYPKSLTPEERESWETFRAHRLLDGNERSILNRYFIRIQELSKESSLTSQQQYLLEELQLYGESIIPEPFQED